MARIRSLYSSTKWNSVNATEMGISVTSLPESSSEGVAGYLFKCV
jgi:hypothetical protein